jgi:hypothetical protein
VQLDASSIIAGLGVSSVGFVLFKYGRKQQRPPQMLGGLLLMVFPYFIPSVVWMLAVGALICVLLWVAVRAGY